MSPTQRPKRTAALQSITKEKNVTQYRNDRSVGRSHHDSPPTPDRKNKNPSFFFFEGSTRIHRPRVNSITPPSNTTTLHSPSISIPASPPTLPPSTTNPLKQTIQTTTTSQRTHNTRTNPPRATPPIIPTVILVPALLLVHGLLLVLHRLLLVRHLLLAAVVVLPAGWRRAVGSGAAHGGWWGAVAAAVGGWVVGAGVLGWAAVAGGWHVGAFVGHCGGVFFGGGFVRLVWLVDWWWWLLLYYRGACWRRGVRVVSRLWLVGTR